MIKLKVCGMHDHENIIQLMEVVNPDFLGFIFYPESQRYLLQHTTEIPAQATPEKRTGVFVNSTKAEIMEMVSIFQLCNVQLHGDESPILCRELKTEGLLVIKAIRIAGIKDILAAEKFYGSIDFFLFDTKGESYGGTGRKFNWDILQAYEQDIPFLLSGGIGIDDPGEIQQLPVKPFAVDINSQFEVEPGVKDIQRIKNFKKQLNQHE